MDGDHGFSEEYLVQVVRFILCLCFAFSSGKRLPFAVLTLLRDQSLFVAFGRGGKFFFFFGRRGSFDFQEETERRDQSSPTDYTCQ